MKKITLTLLLVFSSLTFAQVAIGKSNVSNASISLEFGNENRGLLLPWVTTQDDVASPANGTLIYDTNDKKVKARTTSGWQDLSVHTGTTLDPLTSIDGLILQNPFSEESSAKTSIGTPTATPGILVLEDNNKAMVLPKVVNPHLNIVNPSPGMIVYDPEEYLLCVFNGSEWTYWKPTEI